MIAGIDESGRGPWAGPVVAASVILPPNARIKELNDSKKLTPSQREKVFKKIQEIAIGIGIEAIEQGAIDEMNILHATHLAMRKALKKMDILPDLVLVDGLEVPAMGYPQRSIIKGDGKSASIAAASVIAKVTRDRIMLELSGKYPQYNFHKHKGYGTREHHLALIKYGPCEIHRKSFRPVQKLLKEVIVNG